MKTYFVACLLLLPTVAWGQSAIAPPTAELNLKVTLPEAEIIWKAVRKLPVEEVEGLMLKLRQQVTEQTTPKPVEPPK